MKSIVARHAGVTPLPVDLEPTDAELDAIEAEMPLISAEVELLDALIVLLDRPASEFGARRIRRAHRRVLAARRDAANKSCPVPPAVA
ncbi:MULTISPECIES: DUF6284 family protein [unclassified Streptomyces]|uniref:DUF6284 family protein n=1 Tax=unclassified Streptomyces TaxID=2593676 RepID=UPI00044A6E5B|nr:DUF6284 family protein [Streptomyces sp. PCS3-D2]WKV73888.1 DUF6284 family protein [Streptomyces sp. PCS3-D2]